MREAITNINGIGTTSETPLHKEVYLDIPEQFVYENTIDFNALSEWIKINNNKISVFYAYKY